MSSRQVGPAETATQADTLAVPAGPPWEGKMALKATCPGGLVERVYEWVPGGGRQRPGQPDRNARSACDPAHSRGPG